MPSTLPCLSTYATILYYLHNKREYREECVDRLIEIALYLETYLGVNRLFIP
ncbi:hypothetical protein [Dolichospermum flos-aquae]|jgi:hypothetical protein|uniref:Uncharacterized protein n=1 Tax=Dolichospermum flos-aquae CCAP 1403/13F TaxID=315271 RepID=A0A6H2BV52_DOLFA|nr:hypothetical protein [Dolichospermum flos-aquae]QJB42910.1 hypothetical protein HGD76_00245 [Dolichospermum flos-aquae CCAP 1403/13F]